MRDALRFRGVKSSALPLPLIPRESLYPCRNMRKPLIVGNVANVSSSRDASAYRAAGVVLRRALETKPAAARARARDKISSCRNKFDLRHRRVARCADPPSRGSGEIVAISTPEKDARGRLPSR